VKWAELVEPARAVATNGYVLTHRLAELFQTYKSTLEKYPESKRIFLNGGKGFEEGERLVQPELAQTLGRIGRFGPQEFYTGKTAQLIAADMKANNGLMTLDDLKNYQAKERKPVQGTYRGYEIISMPPPSSGGAIMLEILNILEGYDLRSMGYNSAAKYHVVTEAMRRAFADRAEYMGDSDFVNVPVDTLIDKKYAEKWRETISLTRASPSPEISHGRIAGAEPTETTHYTVVDGEGNIVSNTYTINNGYGSAATVKGAGFLLNDEMDDFAAQPGTPNMFGLIQGERNAVHPGKRPLSAMTPTIVLRKDGTPWFALGAAGGPTIITAVLLGVINVIDHDMNIQQALDMPRIHHQWMPDQLVTEPLGLSPDTRKILESYGQQLSPPRTLARATAIMIDEKGVRLGAVDSRGPGESVGY
jgi:gamma-glutamyltranspeptidase/glutathione hydrolase